jgi:hypothetical protein
VARIAHDAPLAMARQHTPGLALALTDRHGTADRPCPIVEHALRVLRASAHGKSLPAFPHAPNPARVAHATTFAGTYRDPGNAGALTIVAPSTDRLEVMAGGVTHPLLPVAPGIFWTDAERFQLSGVRFITDPKTQHVDQLVANGHWYARASYAGPKTFAHPTRFDAYVGHYRYPGAHPYDPSLRVQLVKGTLVLDAGTPLVPLADGSFRLGLETWNPERLRFDSTVDGLAQRALWSGVPLYRVTTP